MYCSKCGKELKEGWKICPECGTEVQIANNVNSKNEATFVNKPKKKNKIMIPIAIGVIAFLLFILIPVDPIESLKDSTLPKYSDEITIGEAFGNFFTEEKWTSYKENDIDVVCFNGFVYDEYSQKIKVSLEMIEMEESVRFQNMTLYNVNTGQTTYLTDSEWQSLINAIFNNGVFSWYWY